MKKEGWKKIVFIGAALGLLISTSGCATKKYVRQQVDPITGQVSELTVLTKKNADEIKDVDTRAQQGILAANERVELADRKAQAADQKAETAQTMANHLKGQLIEVDSKFESKFGNIDKYQRTETVTLNFPFNQYHLTDKATASLDELASKIKDRNGFVIQIEGYTDTIGQKDYNYELSQKRAQSVVRYLAEKYEVPLYRMFVLGLGDTKPLESNTSRQGRALNRRVEVHLLENSEILTAKK